VADEEGGALMYVERPRYLFLNSLAIFGGIIAGGITFFALSIVAHMLKGAVSPLALGVLAVCAALGSVLVAALAAMLLCKKRHITVYRDDTKTEVLLRVLQNDKIQILTAAYTVVDPQEVPLALIYKKYLHNIFRKRWYCLDASSEPVFTAKEDSIILAILRRFLGAFFGLLRTDFIFFSPDDTILGEFNRRMTLLDRYVLDMTADSLRAVDRRVALAMGVLLDTGEKR